MFSFFRSTSSNADTKVCGLTGQTLPVSEFNKNSTQPDGLHPYSRRADNFRRKLQAKGCVISTTQLREELTNLVGA